ncbi:nitroreductase family protein [Striga hermonthica]|uniref:Nitroreductase family protein n=1 Tax=Striga hermonthica TaxID=68872 RepID=A0A9N7N1I0_STRHE|nr:nitroreductase family protein [Striga hermonthica]
MLLTHYRFPRSIHRHLSQPLPPTTAARKLVPFISMSTSSRPEAAVDQQELLTQVLRYHDQTKHGFASYSRGPHGLDWANQPNPFRRYLAAPLLPLLHPSSGEGLNNPPPLYTSLYTALPPPEPISKTTISQLFYNSLALSAWKTTGFSTWSLRVNPSSGNLHPTEAYIISPAVESLSDQAFVAHYAPKEHALELRARIPSGFFHGSFPENFFLIGLSSIFWREAWKYGERAFRYCNHDVGHAIAAVTMAAAGLGWDVRVLDGFGYNELEKLMGLEKFPKFAVPSRPMRGEMPEIEFEHPDCVLLVFPKGSEEFEVDYEKVKGALFEFSNLDWEGKPNMLSKSHVCWDIIYRTAEAVKKPLNVTKEVISKPFKSSRIISESSYKVLSLNELVRKRRSAVAMDGVTKITKETFFQIMLHCMPTGYEDSREKQGKQLALPFRALPWDSEVHCAIFVHRVIGLPSGLYFLVRNENQFNELKTATRQELEWVKPEGCPEDLPLYELARGAFCKLSERISCHQDIASDGCFSLGMVARLEIPLCEKGAWMYPRLFWETGVLGQVLYLEAHAVGISATGIGCFFDDPVHEVLGFKGSKFQSLYHFTVGGPVVDKRIMSLPAYPGPDENA